MKLLKPLSPEARFLIALNVWAVAGVLMLLAYTVVTYTYFPSLSLLEKRNFDQMARVEIGAQVYTIPWAIFSLPPGPDVERESFLFAVEWPNAAPIYYGEGRLKRDIPDGALGWILVQERGTEIPLDEQFKLHLKDYKTTNISKDIGMDKYVLSPKNSLNSEPYEEVYVHHSNDGHITDLIICTMDVPRPACEHDFYDGSLQYSLDYGMAQFLPQWQALQKRTIDLMNGFKAPAQTEPAP